MRRKGVGLQLMWFSLLLSAILLGGNMAASPQAFNKAVEIQINDQDPRVKADIVSSYLERAYINESLNASIHTGLYRKGKDVGVWRPGEVPSESSIRAVLEDGVKTVLEEEYLSIGSGGGCKIKSGEVSAGISGEEENRMSFSFAGTDPVKVECVSIRQALVGGERSIRSTKATRKIEVPESREVPGLRYLTLAEVARAVATDGEFQSLLRRPAEKSSLVATKECGRTRRNRCDYREIDIDFGDDMPIEQVQERRAGNKLKEELASIEKKYEEEYSNVEISMTVEEMEYRPYSIEQLSQGSTRTGCSQSASDSYSVYTKSCEQCAEDEKCVKEDVTCEEDGECRFGDDRGARCDDSSYCDIPDWADTGLPDKPGEQSGTWTDGRWESTCGSTASDPYTYSGSIDWTSSDVDHRSFTRPMKVRRSGSQHESGGNGETTTCTAECVERTRSCSQSLYPDIKSRESYSFDLQSFTRVEVTVTDTANRIPTREGFRNPVVSFSFEAFGRNTG